METQKDKNITFNIFKKPLVKGKMWIARNKYYGYAIIKKIGTHYYIGRINFSIFKQFKKLSRTTVFKKKPLYRKTYFIIHDILITLNRIHFRDTLKYSIQNMKIKINMNKLTIAAP